MVMHIRFPRRAALAVFAAAALSAGLFFLLRGRPSLQTVPAAAEAQAPARAAPEAPENTAVRTVPILMYHSVCDHPTAKSDYILSPEAFAADLAYLKAHGYETVFLRDLLAFAAGEGTLPAKPVALTFDDGFLNNLTYVLPLLRENGMRGEINIVGEYADKAAAETYRSPLYSYLTWEEIRSLQASGCFEIGSHTYAMHALSPRRGCAQKNGEDDAVYGAALREDSEKMRNALLRERVDSTVIFAYPFGAVSPGARETLQKQGYTVFLTCREDLNVLAPRSPLPSLNRINRTSALSTEEFMRRHGIV